MRISEFAHLVNDLRVNFSRSALLSLHKDLFTIDDVNAFLQSIKALTVQTEDTLHVVFLVIFHHDVINVCCLLIVLTEVQYDCSVFLRCPPKSRALHPERRIRYSV